MEAKGDLYLDRYEGWYSIRDEAYYDASELSESEGGEKLSPQGTLGRVDRRRKLVLPPVELSGPIARTAANPGFLEPESRRNEMISFVAGGLRDLSVSRTSFDWGSRSRAATSM